MDIRSIAAGLRRTILGGTVAHAAGPDAQGFVRTHMDEVEWTTKYTNRRNASA